MEIKTVSDIVNEMNRWLKVKWQHADYHRVLPDAYCAFLYMQDLGMHEALPSLRNDYQSLCEENGFPDSRTNPMVFGLLDLVLEENEGQSSICFVTWLNGQEHVLLRFALDIQHLENGEDSCDAVKSISCDTEEDTLLQDIIMKAIGLQLETGLDFNTRWLAAPESYRSNHPICPVCGGGARLGCEENNGKRRLVCDCCDWVSHKKYYSLSEYTAAQAFQHEIQYQKKLELTNIEISMAHEVFLQALGQLSDAYNNKKKFHMSESQYLSALDGYRKLIDKAMIEVKENSKK